MRRELKNQVPGVTVYSDAAAFRRYTIEIVTRGYDEYKYICTNAKPTKKELQEYKRRFTV